MLIHPFCAIQQTYRVSPRHVEHAALPSLPGLCAMRHTGGVALLSGTHARRAHRACARVTPFATCRTIPPCLPGTPHTTHPTTRHTHTPRPTPPPPAGPHTHTTPPHTAGGRQAQNRRAPTPPPGFPGLPYAISWNNSHVAVPRRCIPTQQRHTTSIWPAKRRNSTTRTGALHTDAGRATRTRQTAGTTTARLQRSPETGRKDGTTSTQPHTHVVTLGPQGIPVTPVYMHCFPFPPTSPTPHLLPHTLRHLPTTGALLVCLPHH